MVLFKFCLGQSLYKIFGPPLYIFCTQFKLFFSIKLIFMLYYSRVKVGGNFLENDFWTPPPPINFVHDLKCYKDMWLQRSPP